MKIKLPSFLAITRRKRQGRPTKSEEKAGKIKSLASGIAPKTYGTYKTATGDQTITVDILEGLYRRTIMRRIINKLVGDATRLGFRFEFYDLQGEIHEEAAEIGRNIDILLTRNLLRTIYRDMLLYGDAFIYKVRAQNQLQKLIPVNPKYLTPLGDTQLEGWQYQAPNQSETITLTTDEIVHIPNDPITGNLFGESLITSALQSLNLILNSQVDAALLLDRYAIPIIHWRIDSKDERRKTPVSEIKDFVENLMKADVGSDIVTDSSIEHDLIGADASLIDFRPLLDKLDHYFFATVGVPAQLLGFPADNLSAITKQLQSYYDTIHDLQSILADYLANRLYKPEIERTITDPVEIVPVFNKPTIENESRIITWVRDALALNLITPEEARQALGYAGRIPEEANDLEWILGGQGGGPEFDKNQKEPK